MGSFFHAVRVFGDHLAAVRWEFLALALVLHFFRLVFRAYAWRTILAAAAPAQSAASASAARGRVAPSLVQ